jgi:hypothetical protein
MREELTSRQELFCQHFALSGRAERSAVAAGTSPASARTRAYRWLKKAEIQDRIEELRDEHFAGLRNQITAELSASVTTSLKTGLCFQEGRRAVALMNRLGVFEHHQRTKREIEELEARFGVPFEVILDAVLQTQLEAE